MTQHLLEGTVEDVDDRATEIEALEDENAQLRAQVLAAADAAHALRRLRAQLTPLYQALQAVFGELDAAGATAAPATAPATAIDARVAPVWEAWKSRLGPSCAKVIDALLLHGAMNTTQLAIAVGTSRKPIPNLIYKLNQAGLISKDGGKFSLKTL